MRSRSILSFGVLVVLHAAACGGQTENDAAGGASSWAGSSGDGLGGTDGAGGSFGSGSTFGTGATSGTGGQPGTGGLVGTGGGSQTMCASGAFDTDLTDDVLTCALWSDCQPGSWRQAGSFDRDATCEPCPDGTYSTFENATLCQESKCTFGQDVVDPGSPTTPRICEDAATFPVLPPDWNIGGLAVTTAGVYLSYWIAYPENYRAARYSLDGTDSSTFLLAEAGQQVPDLAHAGSALYAAGWTYDTDASPVVVTEPAFASRFDADGSLRWSHTFDQDTSEHFSWVQVAASEDAVYVVGIVTMIDCNVVSESVDCGVGATGVHLVLRVLDADGNPTLSTTLQENTTVAALYDIALASDGRLYVLVDRMDVVTGYVDTAVLEFDAAGEVVSEHVLEYVLPQLAADESGNVYALSATDFQPHLYRMAAFGDFFDSGGLGLLGLELEDTFEVLTASDSGVVAVGTATDGPLLVRLDADGNVEAREVLEDIGFDNGFFMGVGEAPDGTVFVAGWNGENRFLTPWP